MAGWTIRALEGGGHQVTHLEDDTGEETLAGEFGAEVALEEIIETVVANSEIADWIIAEGEPLLVVDDRGHNGGG